MITIYYFADGKTQWDYSNGTDNRLGYEEGTYSRIQSIINLMSCGFNPDMVTTFGFSDTSI